MAVRVPFPANVNPEPDANFARGMADAFPSDPHLSAAPRRFPIPTRPTPWLIAAMLVLICLTLSGCGGAEAQERSASASELRRAAAGLWLCPGMTAVWLDDSTAQCLNHLP
ncbi:hypothetical protein D3C78_1090880 [compost metagenome]